VDLVQGRLELEDRAQQVPADQDRPDRGGARAGVGGDGRAQVLAAWGGDHLQAAAGQPVSQRLRGRAGSLIGQGEQDGVFVFLG